MVNLDIKSCENNHSQTHKKYTRMVVHMWEKRYFDIFALKEPSQLLKWIKIPQ